MKGKKKQQQQVQMVEREEEESDVRLEDDEDLKSFNPIEALLVIILINKLTFYRNKALTKQI